MEGFLTVLVLNNLLARNVAVLVAVLVIEEPLLDRDIFFSSFWSSDASNVTVDRTYLIVPRTCY